MSEQYVEPAPNEDGFDFVANGLYIPSFCEKESKNFPGGYGIQVAIGRGTPMWAMNAFGEMQPRYENRVSIDPNVKDAWESRWLESRAAILNTKPTWSPI
ncbi:glucose-methanol-choline oxidoreductase domain protein [Mycobacterium xenopi 4042]|uniref:Glucose-methanol-choline oxidoreductase domain protein n=1 Tax=Mycobacterium xenopi 4042 TaxID=1299334 RepID=X8CLZ8_MYCXE|nr:glucose-methanol-choline oxidoreductase domain protein [Mycobacterium xenopi 4042]